MQRTEAPGVELVKARQAIDRMKSAESLDDFEEDWKEFLRRLERCFNKIQAHYKKSPKWGGWFGRFSKTISNDELLVYLRNARGADEHSVEEIVGRSSSRIGLNPAVGDTIVIKNMVRRGGVIQSMEAPLGVSITFYPEKIKLLPITNRNALYPVPKVHLEKPVNPFNVVDVAECGYRFYESVLSDAEKYFVK